jgi:hypothetical protein
MRRRSFPLALNYSALASAEGVVGISGGSQYLAAPQRSLFNPVILHPFFTLFVK